MMGAGRTGLYVIVSIGLYCNVVSSEELRSKISTMTMVDILCQSCLGILAKVTTIRLVFKFCILKCVYGVDSGHKHEDTEL